VIAPTRFAAGIPHKVTEAAAHGVPVVLTPLLAGQLGWSEGVEALVAEGPAAFAAAVRRVHDDSDLWIQLRRAALAAVRRDHSPERFQSAVAAVV
jgi:glycosyltransferase involved in cell wall biosynthesis